MSELTFKVRCIGFLKRFFKPYGWIRSLRHRLGKWWINQLRRVFVHSSFGPPSGFFSALGGVGESSQSSAILILERQILPPLPEHSLIRIAGMDQNGHQPWPVFTIAMPDMMLVGESLAPMKQGKLLLTEALYDQRFRTEDPAFNHVITGQPLLLKGHWTSIASRWSLGYFHWLMDDLPRLAPILEFPADTGIIIKGKLSSYMREALRILGYESRVRETTEKFLHVENFHFSSPVGMSGCTNPYAVEWLRKTFLPKAQYNLAPELPKKILIVRKGKTRGILNMHILKDALEKRGWIAIDLETVPFAGQIALFANADCIVAEHGAALTNLVWCRPGSKVLELCPTNFLNGCFEGISLCVGIDHYFEIFSADHLSRFTVPLSKLLERVQGW
jgi:hypothetical protein